MAASWSWGVSAAVGVAVLATYGAGAFSIWAIANTLALPMFALLRAHLPTYDRLLSTAPVLVLMIAVQLFAFWLNMQALREAAVGGLDVPVAGFVPAGLATPLVIGLSLAISVAVYRGGLPWSMRTDIGQYGLQFGACIAIVVAALALGTDPAATATAVRTSTAADYQWALWAGLGLLSGPFIDAQQVQRIRLADGTGIRPALWAAGWFGVYMLAVAGVGVVLTATSPILSALFGVVVLAVATSTLDSASAALGMLTGSRTRALTVAAVATLSWPLVTGWGIVSLWTAYASARVFVVATLVTLALRLHGHGVEQYSSDRLAAWRDQDSR